MRADLWSGRVDRVCSTCIYWIEKEAMDNPRKNPKVIGRCRRNAPVVEKGYPTSFPEDWCGQHKLDEEKI